MTVMDKQQAVIRLSVSLSVTVIRLTDCAG